MPKCTSVTCYFDLKLLKKWALQKGHSAPPFCLPESRKWISHMKGALPPTKIKKNTRVARDREFRPSRIYKKICYFFSLLPWAQTLLSSLIDHTKPKCLCPVNFSQIFIFLKKYKGRLIWPLFMSHFNETSLCTNFFLSCLSILYKFYYYSSHKSSRRVEGEIFPKH